MLKVCFFTTESYSQVQNEQYVLQDINILKDLGFSVYFANKFSDIPPLCDFIFSWWVSGSIIPLIKAHINNIPIFVVGGGNETTFYRDSITNKPHGYLNYPIYKKLAVRLTLRFSTAILPVSAYVSNFAKKMGANNIHMIYNSINTKLFNNNGIGSHILSIFNLETNTVEIKRGKNFILAIPYVLQKFPNQKFIIIGKKVNAYEGLLELCKKLNISNNIKFVGSIPNIEIVDWFQKSIGYIQVSDTETFGVAIAEAMACGKPVIVSNRGAIPEIVGDNGIYVNHNDPKNISQGIIKLLSMKKKYFSIISNNNRKKIIKNYSYAIRKGKIKTLLKSYGLV